MVPLHASQSVQRYSMDKSLFLFLFAPVLTASLLAQPAFSTSSPYSQIALRLSAS